MKTWLVVGDFMGGTMTDLQMICHSLVVNLLLLRMMAYTHSLLSVVDVDSCPSCSASVTFVLPYSTCQSICTHHQILFGLSNQEE
jgi:hypothetical protein